MAKTINQKLSGCEGFWSRCQWGSNSVSFQCERGKGAASGWLVGFAVASDSIMTRHLNESDVEIATFPSENRHSLTSAQIASSALVLPLCFGIEFSVL